MEKLITKQGAALTGTPWEIYPRPQMRRDSYLNLNGIWDLTVTETPERPDTYDRKIRVPF